MGNAGINNAGTGGSSPPTGKNQLGLNGTFTSTNIWPFLNILKLAGSATQLTLTPSIASATWTGGVATFTTVNPHGLYNGVSSQSGWAITIQGATPTGYNGNFSCTITGASTFTCPIAVNPVGSSTTGQAVLQLFSTNPPNTPNSAYGQGNNLNQYFDANGDVQPNIADLFAIQRIIYTAPSGPYPAGYSRGNPAQNLTLDWTGDPGISGGVNGGGSSTGNTFSFNWQTSYDLANITIAFTFSSSAQRANPPKNLRLYLTDNQAAINGSQIFEPAYLSMLRQGSGVVRFMDWMLTNNSPVLTYSSFATEAYRQWGEGGIFGVSSAPYGMPISVMTRLANVVNKHPWFNIPGRMGTPKFATAAGYTRSVSAGGTTIVKTTSAHNFVANDTVILYGVEDTNLTPWGQSATVTINVSTATVTWPGHAFVKGQNVFFDGALGNITVSGQSNPINQRSFYVANPNTGAGTFQLAATAANAVATTAVIVTLTGTASAGTITGTSRIDRSAFTVGPSNLTANTFELLNCDSTNFGALIPTVGQITSPFSLSGMTTEITNMVSAIKSQLNGQLVPRFEYSNETWNLGTFDQGSWLAAQAHNFVDASSNPIFPSDDSSGMTGYMAAHAMKTIRDIYGGAGGRALWHGILATQTGNPGVTPALVNGVTYYKNNFAPAAGLTITDFFNDVAVTGYYGLVFRSNGAGGDFANITISIGTNAKVTLASYANVATLPIGTPIMFSTTGTLPTDAATGQPLKTWSASTPPALSNNAGIYWITSKDTGTGATFTSSNNNGVLGPNVTTSGSQSGTQGYKTAAASMIANWMNDSAAHNTIDPVTYPTKYSFFNTMMNLEVGDGRFMQSSFNVASMASQWAPHIVAGLGMVQYEGGSGNYADGTQFAANGTKYVVDPQTKEFFPYAFGTAEDAANWTGLVAAWQAFGTANSVTVSYPSKFTDATNVSYSNQLLASFGANYYVDHFQGVGTGVPGNPLWNAIVNTN